MSLASVNTRARIGLDAPRVCVEIHLSNGLPAFHLVGMAETSVREAKNRVRSAIINSGFEFPQRKIIVSLAPADLPKDGGHFDLPIAVAILIASKQLPDQHINDYEFAGELALNGQLRKIIGDIPMAMAARQELHTLVLPCENARQACRVEGSAIIGLQGLNQLFAHFSGQQVLPFEEDHCTVSDTNDCSKDMSDVIGQPLAKRALELAAAGSHNLLFIGPPGTGKTMLASRLPSILPPMTKEESLQTAAVNSICHDDIDLTHWHTRPFRAPHHTASSAALVGGGSTPIPGEISLAHNGILFLDELPEYDRKVLDVLREPMESGHVTISRALRKTTYPARFQLVAAMNPSPTGFYTDRRSTPEQILRYLNKLSGPFLDRIDIQLEVARLPKGLWNENDNNEEASDTVRQRVVACRQRQLSRQGKANAHLSSPELKQYCQLNHDDAQFLDLAMEKIGLSTRAHHKILKIARTIADLNQQAHIGRSDLVEALSYRAMDRLIRHLTESVNP
ncbi:YifB family Mg chelatase-like AAA ATPase [Thalassotalea ponticola]|uniref:YifB family Mg chelatase-like AAA ATPase n=1 Tax=Thalassotalea ponticola TaxID=1523392 RepID=UPI0025B4C254|nr:YifB family Mg chelatase-like AAA ATPase [Thalassotalea ponticola]MDN3652475.1 YifB family Mg chelatase-like AAA ATPase [Thalassotalea ponticola]